MVEILSTRVIFAFHVVISFSFTVSFSTYNGFHFFLFFYFLACHWYKRFILLLFKLVNKLGKTQDRFFRVKKLSVMSAILSHRLMVYSRRNSRWFEHWKNQRSWLHGIFRSLARIAGRGVRSRTGARWQDQHTKESRANGKKGAFVLTTSIAKTMHQTMKLIGRLTKNCKVAVRTAITLELFFSSECLG